MKRALLVALTAVTLFHLRDAQVGAQTPSDSMTFFKNYFVTGDVVTAGVGLRGQGGANGVATGTIQVQGVPAGADIVAAFLYWQVVTTSGPDTGSLGVKFKGYNLSIDNPATPASDPEPFGKSLAFAGTAPCYNPGGSTGSGGATTWTYRADVLRFFATDLTGTAQTNPNYGKLSVNASHAVSIPDSGPNGNQSPMAVGASLVVVYRLASMNLSAIVLYDDGVTLNNSQRTLVQPIQGFYQASAAPNNAKISYIVGSGQAAKNDFVLYPGGGASNEFSAGEGANWDTRTYPATVTPNAAQIETTISNDVSGSGGRDCLTLAAIVFKTEVLDTDHDGLLDVWETAGAPVGGTPQLIDPKGQPLPLLGAMGATPTRKDLFVEIGYMGVAGQVDGPDVNPDLDSVSYGGLLRPPHHHGPGHEALKLVGDAFANAPDGGMALHFDVGDSYLPGDADPYIIRDVGSTDLARGGEAIDEMATVCTPGANAPEWECQYKGHPGTVGWKSGFRFLRDQVLSVNGVAPPANFDEELCGTTVGATTYSCTRRFDSNRMQMFRYALFAHALGLPKSEKPCLAAAGAGPAVDAGADDRCAAGTTPNPDFHTPRTNTGIGDFPGADTLVTLGAFLDYDNVTPTATPFMQAATLTHEMGHTMGRRHGGEAFEPNCKPQYFSVMNYAYQLRGLVGADGLPTIDFSANVQTSIFDEASLIDGPTGVNSLYRMAWYAPIVTGGSLASRPGIKASLRHCDGSTINLSEYPVGATGYVRLESPDHGSIDWAGDGVINTGTRPPQDVNFDGLVDSGPFSLRGSNDWTSLQLNQIGSRRNVGGLFVDPTTGALIVGPLSGDVGKGDLGKGDLGKGDLGKGDLGKGDLGKGDLGKGDLGKGDLGKGDLGKGDLGDGDLFGDDGEIDETLANDLTRVPPYAVAACQFGGVNCPPATPTQPQDYVRVSWTAPSVGGIIRYTVYRALRDALSGLPGLFASAGIVTVPAVQGADNRKFEWIDPNSHRLVQGQTYLYYVTATYLVRNAVANLLEELESIGSTPDAPVTITNANPTIAHAIAAQTILTNSSTADLAFTVGDLETFASGAAPANVLTVGAAVTGSTNADLTSQISFSFGGSGTNRTVKVTHTGLETGTITITLTTQDTQCSHAGPPVPCSPGTTNSTTFTVTVNPQVTYAFAAVQNLPPSKTKAGSTTALKWQYKSGATVVNSAQVTHRVTVCRVVSATQCNAIAELTNTDSGGSSFRYSGGTWTFNLQTKYPNGQPYEVGDYKVTIDPDNAGYQTGGPYPLQLTK